MKITFDTDECSKAWVLASLGNYEEAYKEIRKVIINAQCGLSGVRR